MKDSVPGVYLIQNPLTMETYVGSSKNLKSRLKEHKTKLKTNKHCNSKLQDAFNKDSNFDFVTIVLDNEKDTRILEQSILDEHSNNPLLLNICKNVSSPMAGLSHSEETKKIIGLKSLGKIASSETRERMSNSRKGVKHSKEHSEKISQSLKGRKPSVKAIEASVESRKNIPLTEEHKTKISISHKKLMEDPDYKAKIVQSLIGRPVSEETRNKISQSNLGKVRSQEVIDRHIDAISKPISVNGVNYKNMKEVAKIFNISIGAVVRRLDSTSGKFPNWNRIKK